MSSNKQKSILPLAAMEKLLKKAGAARVGDDAKEALREVLEDHAFEIGEKAWKIAQHSGRRTIKAGDIKLAVK
jgi:histone H3/H4